MGDVLSQLDGDVLAHMPKRSSLVRGLLRHRKESILPNPNTVNFNLPEKYCKLVLHDSGVNDPGRILVLGDKDLSLQLKKTTIYGNGTFDKVPSIFYQLYTWHAKVGNSYSPCIYILLQKKNIDTYNRMFQIMKNLIPDLLPQKVFVDFEKAVVNAAIIAFPEAEIKGCFFHLCKSLMRKVSSVGLKMDYEADINTKLKLKSLPALTFVPLHQVKDVFNDLAATFPDEDRYNQVLNYFFTTYIEGVAGREPQFPIRIWNHHDAALEQSPKTTNCCKGFHNALNSIFHCSHPSIWYLLEGLERDLATTTTLACHKLTLMNAEAGRPEVKKKKYAELHSLIAMSFQQYDQEKDKLKYLWRLANLF